MNKVLLKEVARKFFIGNPVKIGQNVEGQAITEGNAYLLGCYAGPSQNEENLFHEMCHLAEREKEKLVERPHNSWGFSFGKYWEVLGRSGWEPSTEQSVLREARVWSFQLSLMRHFQIDITAEELARSAVYLSAFCYFKFKRVSKKLDYQESEKLAVSLLAALVEKQTEIYTYNRFVEDWNSRMELLKKTVDILQIPPILLL